MASHRLKRVKNWRMRHKSWIAGYQAGDLRPNDIQFLHAIVGSIGCFFLLFIIAGAYDGAVGFISPFPMLYIMLCFLIGSTVIYQSRDFSTKEMVYWGIINLTYLVIGMGFFMWEYEVAEFTIDVTKSDAKQQQASYFVLFYVLLAPSASHALTVIMRYIDRGPVGITTQFKIFGIVVVAGIALIVLCCFLFLHWIVGVACLGVFIVFLYAAA
mmetsp:Transcript_25040/g.38850  ORF Transcript_25040/g.38850 Transcript_25040/m.38850 type:complete len:213 (+) Transcript_25040:2519-3157(+)